MCLLGEIEIHLMILTVRHLTLQRKNLDFHFHDLRHSWASGYVQAGMPLFSLKELGGWETLEMVKKYAHLNANHLMTHADNVKFMSQF